MDDRRSTRSIALRHGILRRALVMVLVAIGSTLPCHAQTRPVSEAWTALSPPVVNGAFLRPADGAQARPVWGHAQGLSVGIAPMPGPRGLLRVYAPYLGHPDGKMINFIAVEPIMRGETARGLSELEFSRLDQRRGKRFWSMDEAVMGTSGGSNIEAPARGRIIDIEGVKALCVFVGVESFDNGADVYLRLTFREDRPHAVGIATFARASSKPLSRCIVTATMGNFARLRILELADRAVSAHALWADYRDTNFTQHARFPLRALRRDESGAAIVTARGDEMRPKDAQYAPGTRDHWRYSGTLARQIWWCEKPDPALEVLVNGRFAYWNSRSAIPGGISFEKFEMSAPFRDGQEFWFSVEPIEPDP